MYCRGKGVDRDLDRMIAGIDEIENGDVIHVRHRPASHERPPGKTRKKSVVNREVVQRVVRNGMQIHRHHDVTEKTNVKKNHQRNVDARRNQVAASPRNLHANRNVPLKINRASVRKESAQNATTMQKNGLEQKNHPKENPQMMHRKKTWILQTLHKTYVTIEILAFSKNIFNS